MGGRLLGRLSGAMLAAGVAGCVQAPQSCSLVRAASVPLSLLVRNSKIAVPVTLDGVTLRLVVDTGSERTVLDRKALHRYETTGGFAVVSGIGGSRGADLAELRKLQLGGLHGSVSALALDLGDHPPAPGTVGLLGMDIMGAYDMDLDIGGGELGFYLTDGNCAAPAAALGGTMYAVKELPYAMADLRPHVAVQAGGQSFVALLDTGSPVVTMSAGAARRLGLTDDVLRGDPVMTMRGVGPDVEKDHLHFLDLSLGDLLIRNVPVLISKAQFGHGVDMILGLDLAKRIHFWLSSSSRTLVMQYPPMPTGVVPDGAAK